MVSEKHAVIDLYVKILRVIWSTRRPDDAAYKFMALFNAVYNLTIDKKGGVAAAMLDRALFCNMRYLAMLPDQQCEIVLKRLRGSYNYLIRYPNKDTVPTVEVLQRFQEKVKIEHQIIVNRSANVIKYAIAEYHYTPDKGRGLERLIRKYENVTPFEQ
jgi:hypothetical protein